LKKQRILVAPLNWGLGHASRCFPIIQHLIDLQIEVILGGDGESFTLLKKEFPDLENIQIEGYHIRYPAVGNMTIHFLKQYKKMRQHLRYEHACLNDLIEEKKIDAVISDNRYGLYSREIPCVFLTHQVNFLHPWFASFINKKIHKAIEQFTQCWVVDTENDDSLAGKLSKTDKLSNLTAYTGPLSRFTNTSGEKIYDVIAILSGPEPSRSILEIKIVEQLNEMTGNHLLIRGTYQKTELNAKPGRNIQVHDMLTSRSLDEKINASRFIVSRSGYSSIMDYVIKGRNALLIPTPGQTEQEYLASFHRSKGRFLIQQQNQLDLKQAVIQLSEQKETFPYKSKNDLKNIIEDFCDSLT